MIRRLLTSAAAAAVLAGGLVAATEAPASAASCTGSTVIFHKVLTSRGIDAGYVDLEYSTACHSARAHIHSIYKSHPGDTHGASATIDRVNSSAQKSCTLGEGDQDCRTAWLYDLNPYKATAFGSIDMYPLFYDYAEGRTAAY